MFKGEGSGVCVDSTLLSDTLRYISLTYLVRDWGWYSLSVHASHSFLSFFFLFRIKKDESGNNVTLKPCLPTETLFFFFLFLFFFFEKWGKEMRGVRQERKRA